MRALQNEPGSVKSNTTTAPAWRYDCLRAVPDSAEARRLAQQMRKAVQPNDPFGPLVDLRAVCRAGRFRVIERKMGGEAGGAQAVLVPQPGNRFHIWVDPTPRGGWERIEPALRQNLRRHRLRFRVAHEIAHALFYRRGGGEPRRVLGDSAEQEKFADEFARALLVSTTLASEVAPTPSGVLGLQDRCDVSLELAARAFADARPELTTLLACWPAGTLPTADSALVQWASEDLVRQGGEVSRHRLRTIIDMAQCVLRGDRSERLRNSGTALMLPRRRQLLWISADATVSGFAQS